MMTRGGGNGRQVVSGGFAEPQRGKGIRTPCNKRRRGVGGDWEKSFQRTVSCPTLLHRLGEWNIEVEKK